MRGMREGFVLVDGKTRPSGIGAFCDEWLVRVLKSEDDLTLKDDDEEPRKEEINQSITETEKQQ